MVSDLDAVGVGEIGIDVVRVDEAEEVDLLDVADVLHLAQLDVEQLHERAVLAMRQLVAVADGRLADAEARRDVRLRERAAMPSGSGWPRSAMRRCLPRAEERASAKPRARSC